MRTNDHPCLARRDVEQCGPASGGWLTTGEQGHSRRVCLTAKHPLLGERAEHRRDGAVVLVGQYFSWSQQRCLAPRVHPRHQTFTGSNLWWHRVWQLGKGVQQYCHGLLNSPRRQCGRRWIDGDQVVGETLDRGEVAVETFCLTGRVTGLLTCRCVALFAEQDVVRMG